MRSRTFFALLVVASLTAEGCGYQRLEGESATRAKDDSGEGAPSWFASGTGDKYEIRVYKDEPRGHFVVQVDKASGALFLTDYQL